jgi:lipoate-protein ligase A
MPLDILPFRIASAAENMAMDFLLLRRYPQPHARFRHYEWHRPAFTFGYSQKLAFVRQQLTDEADEILDLCRRPTGGGIVDHRDDWTYSLILPRGHPLEEARATDSYREIHTTLTAALQKQDVQAEVQTECEPTEDGKSCKLSGICFQRAELYDIVHSGSGQKIAGAAQKRNKNGLLFQGSLCRPAVQAEIDWATLEEDFIAGLAQLLQTIVIHTPWPEFAEGETDGIIEQYSSTEWLEYR